jgi:ABC-type phosphate/phosphonate transport system substrate-binding protein
MSFTTSTRMYNVAPGARSAWHALFDAAYKKAGLEVEFIEHGWPTPIGELWQRPQLCGVFMCGWPFIHAKSTGTDFKPLASVIPDWPAYEGKPRYRSEFLVREDSPWSELKDAVGSRYGWMVQDSQSGWNAPRAELSKLIPAPGATLFSESKGPYGNPRGLLAALSGREIDLTALDSWYLDLLRTHDPGVLAGIRTLAFTPWTPNPLVVASPDLSADTAATLSETLYSLHKDPEHQAALKNAHVSSFVPVDVPAYDVLLDMASDASARGYPLIR